MKKNKFIISILILTFTSLSYETYDTAFVNQTKQYLLTSSKALQNSLDSVLGEINLQDSIITDKSKLITLFKQVRFNFKKIEFIADYAAEDVFKIPIILDKKRNFYIEAFAFHILIDIEALLAEEEIPKQELKILFKEFQYKNLQFYELLQSNLISESIILEAIKYNIIKIETLNITDFDSETTQNTIADIHANLMSIDTCLNFLHPQVSLFIQNKINQTHQHIQNTDTYLATKNFLSLDRLFFTKKYIHPLNQLYTEILIGCNIPLNEEIYTIIRAVNLKSNNIYNNDFIYTPFYNLDKNRKITETEIELGKYLFFDKRLSADNKMSCATCHQPEQYFTDGLPTSITNKIGEFQDRNTPTLLNTVFQRNQFYDLRAKSLEQQVSMVVNNHQEFNNNYDTIIARLKQDDYYIKTFNQLYHSENAINATTINMAITAFEHQLTALNSKFDKYMRNETQVINDNIKNGYNLFMGKAKCGTCHFAPTYFGTVPPFYSESESEVLGIPKIWDTLNFVLSPDIGRYNLLKFDFFKNSFKTSTVRNAEHTAPYMHNGSFKTLEDVIDFYNRGGGTTFIDVPNQTLSAKSLNLSSLEKQDIISFIRSLTDSSFNTIKVPRL